MSRHYGPRNLPPDWQSTRSPNMANQQQQQFAEAADAVVFQSPRGSFNGLQHIGVGRFIKVLEQDFRRCYLEIQNQSGTPIQYHFGNTSATFELRENSTWYSIVTPVDAIWMRAPLGANVMIMFGLDL